MQERFQCTQYHSHTLGDAILCCTVPKTLVFVLHQGIFRATQNVFNQYNIYLYTAGTIFCQHVFLFCATLNILSLRQSLFWVSHNFFLLPQNIFCDSHNFAAQHNFYVEYFFLLTQQFFVQQVTVLKAFFKGLKSRLHSFTY